MVMDSEGKEALMMTPRVPDWTMGEKYTDIGKTGRGGEHGNSRGGKNKCSALNFKVEYVNVK